MSDAEINRLLGHALKEAVRRGIWAAVAALLVWGTLVNADWTFDDRKAILDLMWPILIAGFVLGFLISFARRRRVIRRNPLEYVGDGRWHH